MAIICIFYIDLPVLTPSEFHFLIYDQRFMIKEGEVLSDTKNL